MEWKALGRKVPWKERFEELLDYAGYYKVSGEEVAGMFLALGIAAGAGSLGIIFIITKSLLYSLVSLVTFFTALQLAPFVYLSLTANSRAGEVDTILPDALQLMAANIRAGMTTERAIWLSARPEFGPLEEEIHRLSSKVMGGKPLPEALKEMSSNIDSDLLDRAVKLMIEGIRSGGEMATLLDETATDIRTAQNMKEKVKANVTMYSMFIVFASVLGAPLLFAISLYFIEVTSELWAEELTAMEGVGEMGAGMISMKGPQIGAATLELFSVGAIAVTTFFGGMIIGLIQEGEATSGLKYSPLMMAAALAIFFVANLLVTRLFGGFIGL
ncbi:MAG: type II secretion system F family protein [Candidatus Aenigmatarchaeota archaeon]